MADYGLGWLRERDDRDWLRNAGRPYVRLAGAYEAPEELDPRRVVKIEDQGQRNSCVGHMSSSAAEICGWLDSGGKFQTPFSRWGAYIWAQRKSGFEGRDQGAGIAGAVQAGADWGYVPESLWPYPAPNARYSNRDPKGAAEAARPYRHLQHTPLQSYDQVIDWIKSGRGPVMLGVSWTSALSGSQGLIRLRDVRGNGGGHAITLWGWDRAGRIPLINSHSEGWGDGGVAFCEPEAVDYWAESGDCEVTGISDLASVEQARRITQDWGTLI